MTIGELIRSYRKENRYSMQEFADKCGLSKAYIGHLENGRDGHGGQGDIDIKFSTYEKLSKGLNMSVDDILNAIGRQIHMKMATPIEMYELLDAEDRQKVGFYIEALLSDVKYKKAEDYSNQVG